VPTSRIADSVGRVLGDRYRLIRPLGTGASAHVFVAEDVNLRRRVAVKVLHPGLAGDDAFLRRFRAEAQVVASLRHPNILRVYDWGETDGSPYLVMELLEGGSLRSMLDQGIVLTPAQAATVGADVARALDHAHRRGLVHRDIKPANLIFDDEGRVAIADFGLARALAEATWTEPTGAVVGTARYASPETVRGAALDGRADVYSLALVLIEAVTGAVPFAADTTIGTLMARVEQPIPVPDEAGPLKPALESAGGVDPADRPDAAGLARSLDRVADQLPPPAPLPLAGPLRSGLLLEQDDADPTLYPDPVVLPGRSELRPPKRRRRKGLAVVAAVALLALAGGGVFAWADLTGRFRPAHAVPDLVGMPQAEAVGRLRVLHLGLSVAGHQYSSRYRSGDVLSQTPARGALREGHHVRVVLSAGPQPVRVPTSLRGYPEQSAEAVLKALGLTYRTSSRSDMTIPAGQVISSAPDSGTLVPGKPVQLVISTGKPTVAVPGLSPAGRASFAAARVLLARAGLGATQSNEYSDTVPAGEVIAFRPPSGASVAVGTVVTVRVSKGPHLAVVPDLSQDSVGAATQALENSGFAVSGVQGNPLGTVIGTSPAGGSTVHYGSAVLLLTG